jgi:hypothetical protein
MSNLEKIQIPVLAIVCSYASNSKERTDFKTVSKKWRDAGFARNSWPVSFECLGNLRCLQTEAPIKQLKATIDQSRILTEVFKLTSLTSLKLQFTHKDCFLWKVFYKHPVIQNLTVLHLDCGSETKEEESASEFLTPVKHNYPNLTDLALVNFKQECQFLVILRDVNFPKLTVLNLHNSASKAVLRPEDPFWDRLLKLDLGNDTTPGPTLYVPDEMKSTPALQELSICGRLEYKQISAILTVCQQLHKLTVVNYKHIPADDNTSTWKTDYFSNDLEFTVEDLRIRASNPHRDIPVDFAYTERVEKS